LYTYLIDLSNYFFTAIFTIEMILKMQAYSWRYFETAWNKFDFFIVMASLLDIIISMTPTEGNEVLSVGPQIARIMRVLRVTRVIKLAGKNKDLQALM
jgi:voltage-dependent calcium channel L type alpha-1D